MVEADRDGADERVRRELAALGADASTASEVPPQVSARIVANLRAQPTRGIRSVRLAGLVAGAAAAVTAVGVTAFTDGPAPRQSPPGATAERLTTSRPAVVAVPPDLGGRPADLGALAAPGALGACLSGLGYPAEAVVLGGRTLTVAGIPAVQLLLPRRLPGGPDAPLRAVTVAASCSARDPGVLAESAVPRP